MNDDDRREALDILGDALRWHLPAPRWRVVEDAVAEMAEALARGDLAAFRTAESTVELAGPVRAVSAVNPPADPVPEPVRERINELVHTLGASEPDDDGAAAPG